MLEEVKLKNFKDSHLLYDFKDGICLVFDKSDDVKAIREALKTKQPDDNYLFVVQARLKILYDKTRWTVVET